MKESGADGSESIGRQKSPKYVEVASKVPGRPGWRDFHNRFPSGGFRSSSGLIRDRSSVVSASDDTGGNGTR